MKFLYLKIKPLPKDEKLLTEIALEKRLMWLLSDSQLQERIERGNKQK